MPFSLVNHRSSPGVFAATALLTALAIIAAYAGAVYGVRGTQRGGNSFLVSLVNVKEEHASERRGRRLLIVGGSSGLLGIRAVEMERQVGLPTVNLSLHGGLGPNYILYVASRIARPGDVVLLSIEYPLFVGDTLVNDPATLTSWSRGDGYETTLDWMHRLDFMRGLQIDYVLDGWDVLMRWRHPPIPIGRGWPIQLVNKWGDFIVTSPDAGVVADRNRNLDEDRRKMKEREPPRLDAMAPNLLAIRDSIRAMQARGVTLLATWPNIANMQPYTDYFKFLRTQIRQWYEHQGVVFIAPADGGLIAPSELYDTPFHPGGAAATARTRVLSTALCQQTTICVTGADSTD